MNNELSSPNLYNTKLKCNNWYLGYMTLSKKEEFNIKQSYKHVNLTSECYVPFSKLLGKI